MKEIAHSSENLPMPDQFNKNHRQWRQNVIKAAETEGLLFTHGVAAKLINVYLKSAFLCPHLSTDERVMRIHPPIDSVLLDSLYKNDIGKKKAEWQKARSIRWSKLDSSEYESLIAAIREFIPEDEGLWTIEEHWQGFQSNNPE